MTTPRHGNEPNKKPASLARRAFPALVMAGAAGALLTALDHPAGAGGSLLTVDAASGATASAAGASRTPASSATTAPTATAPATKVPSGPTSKQSTSTTAVVTATKSPSTTPSTAAPTAAAAAASCTGDTIDGPTVNTKWGPVQVEAVFASDGTLCDVKALKSPDSHGKSVRINNQALPILHDRVIAAQGTKIYAVSGATITSNAYAASLQSVLDAHPVK